MRPAWKRLLPSTAALLALALAPPSEPTLTPDDRAGLEDQLRALSYLD